MFSGHRSGPSCGACCQCAEYRTGGAIALSEGLITILSDQGTPLVLTAPSGGSLEISFPANDVLGPTVQLSDGSAVLPGQDSSTTVIPVDSSVQLISTAALACAFGR